MRKIIAGLLVIATLMPTVAKADWYGHHHHGGGYYRGGGGDAGVALFGGLVGGLIIGGMLNNMNQPQYYAPQPYYYQPQTFCRAVPVYDAWGNYVGRQRQCWQQ